ncbi:MAG TPA: zinc-dependent alcohol dehydrogenase family protein [Solirubrobacterales bacterium]|nr:zinc-dependent alcohol dehydrogenase family protein [Solirubrobacterales bacterium]
MRAMVIESAGSTPVEREVPDPSPGDGEVAVTISACGVCRTDLHVIDGELAGEPKLPLVPGHQIVGRVAALGAGVEGLDEGERVGIPWLGWTCGECRQCRAGRENLCERAEFTGYTRDGGYAERAVADARFCFPLGEGLDDVHAAPLLCAGLIGYRALRMCGDPERLGLYGFGSSAHLIAQLALDRGIRVFAFTREGDEAGQEFARGLGAEWAGASGEPPPEPLDAAIIFAPVGELVPMALRAVGPGGAVVCAGIHMSEIPAFPYEILWEERQLRSVANLTRRDGREFLPLAAKAGVEPEVTTYPLADAGRALEDLRAGRVEGSAVLVVRD